MVPSIGILLPVLLIHGSKSRYAGSKEWEILYGWKTFPEKVTSEGILRAKRVVNPAKILIVRAFQDGIELELAPIICRPWDKTEKLL